ncbi:MAG: tetratricopeptide repeat protein [Chitinophagales bacterium]|nr:tetratricopeptide repeat protein [Chitinophagales bacterium]MDW8273996.1 tetratricopeptide repeat protein [Chitinophagales bacterium]
MNSHFKYFSYYILVLALLCHSCATTNQAPIHKQIYHDITSRYNAYHNAYEKWKATIKNIENNHKDDFKEVISVFSYTDPKETSAFSSDCDDIIKRSSTAIQYHPYSNWSDDHFLLIGKAYFLKGDYEKAAQTFRYISTKYKEGVDYIAVQKERGKKYSDAVKKKKPKKDPNKPRYKVIKNKDGTRAMQAVDTRPKRRLEIHDPARSAAIVWLVKALTSAKQYGDAEAVIAYARSDNKFYRDYDLELLLSEADLFIKQKNYAAAVTSLEKALTKLKRKPRARTRPLFALAQCYEAMGNYAFAQKTYKDVLKARPNYDMEFYAKIKRAKLARSSSGNNSEIKLLLLKMSRDGKNKDYLDQIYYELAEISLAENDKASARKYFRKSIDANTNNREQRALSFLRLGDTDFEDELYESAKYNYDSCLMAMNKDDKRYASLEFKNKILSRLVENLQIIHKEDSLQKIARMSDEERKRFVQKIIAQRQKEEEEKENKKTTSSVPTLNAPGNISNDTKNKESGSTWYFYNTALRAQGYTDFIKRWGNRKYEDNWRRKDKSVISTGDDTQAQGNAGDTSSAKKAGNINQAAGQNPNALNEEDKILQGVPLTPEALKTSNERLALAYFNTALIYKDDLSNYRKALTTFEELNTKVPGHKFLLEDYYYCYLLCKDYLNNSAKAEFYKNKILSDYPQSKISALLRNANFLNEEIERQNEINNYYANAYNDFANGALASASEKVLMSYSRFNPNPLKAKFDLLYALILARQNRLEDYVQELNKIIAKCDDPEIKKTAENLLSMLNNSGLPMQDLSKMPAQTAATDSAQGQTNNQIIASQAGIDNKKDTSAALSVTDNNKGISTTGKYTQNPDTTASKQPPVKQHTVQSSKDTSSGKTGNTSYQKPTAKADSVISPYKYNPESPHLVMMFFKDSTVNQNTIIPLVNAFNQFNNEKFGALKLAAKSVLIDEKNKLISIRQFKNKAAAAEYMRELLANKTSVIKNMEDHRYFIASISLENFTLLLSERKGDLYEKFYNWKYAE